MSGYNTQKCRVLVAFLRKGPSVTKSQDVTILYNIESTVEIKSDVKFNATLFSIASPGNETAAK